MPLPWRALSVVLKQAPAVLAAADALLIGSRQRRRVANAADEVEALRQRLAALEQQQGANAELSKQLAEHATAIAAAAQATAEKARQAFILALVGVTLALAALLLVWLR
jgi:hypothetical protein